VLQVWARGLSGLESAVGLLVRHRFWLGRSDFLAVAVETERDSASGDLAAWVDFDAAIAALKSGRLPCSSSQAQLLQIAASLAIDTPVALGAALCGLDERAARAVASAVLHAAGHEHRFWATGAVPAAASDSDEASVPR
jgi:hypothetical protein